MLTPTASIEGSENKPHHGKFIVYLNGLLMRGVRSVSTAWMEGQIPQLNLVMAPSTRLERLGAEDRLEVVVFALNDRVTPSRYEILFDGEIVGWSYVRSAAGRSVQFDAVLDIAMLQQLKFFFMNTVDAIAQLKGGVGQNEDTIATGGVFYPFSLFRKGLYSGAATDGKDPTVETPFEIMYNVVRGLVASRIDEKQVRSPQFATIPAVNFFARWVRKRNFVNRFVSLPILEDPARGKENGVFPILRAVQDETALASMSQSLASTVAEAGSVLAVLESVFAKVYMNVAMTPSPACVRARLKDGQILGLADLPSRTPLLEPLRLMNYYVKPQLTFGVPPSCNVVFPSQIENVAYTENYAQQITRFAVNEGLVTGALGLENMSLAGPSLRYGYPPEVNSAIRNMKIPDPSDPKSRGAANLNARNLLVFPEEFFRGPVPSSGRSPGWFQLVSQRSKRYQVKAKQDASTGDQSFKLERLFDLYAQHEYHRQRLEKRGGTVAMPFNPYVIPGYPCVIFDTPSNAFHLVGYVRGISHDLNAQGSMRTTMHYGFGRTLTEWLAQIKTDSEYLGAVVASSPVEPIDTIREVSQDFAGAEEFYGKLLHGGTPTDGRKAAFDFREVLGYADLDAEKAGAEWAVLETEDLYTEGQTVGEAKLRFMVDGAAQAGASGATNNSTASIGTGGSSDPDDPAYYSEQVQKAARQHGVTPRVMIMAAALESEKGGSDDPRGSKVRQSNYNKPEYAKAVEVILHDAMVNPKRDFSKQRKQADDRAGILYGTAEGSAVKDKAIKLAKAFYDARDSDPYADYGHIPYLDVYDMEKLYPANLAKIQQSWGSQSLAIPGVQGLGKHKFVAYYPENRSKGRRVVQAKNAPGGTVAKTTTPATQQTNAQPVHVSIDVTRPLRPQPPFAPMFRSYDEALRWSARPICSLEEYVRFLHGDKAIDELVREGQVSGPSRDTPDVGLLGVAGIAQDEDSPVIYSRIRSLRPLRPADAPTPAQRGASVSPTATPGGVTATAPPYVGPPDVLPADFAQTRDDWDARLIAYNQEMSALEPRR